MLDNYTKDMLLEVLRNGSSNDEKSDVYKMLTEMHEGPAREEVVEYIESNIGKYVTINGTSHLGVVHSANKADSGWYPGGRYPWYIKISKFVANEKAREQVFEYAFDNVKLLDIDVLTKRASVLINKTANGVEWKTLPIYNTSVEEGWTVEKLIEDLFDDLQCLNSDERDIAVLYTFALEMLDGVMVE